MKFLIHGVGILVLLLAFLDLSRGNVAEESDSNESIENEEYARMLRSDPAGFTRILKSVSESEDEDEEPENPEKRSSVAHFSRILRSQPPSTFSRILRGSFSRILKRDPVSFSRILKRDSGTNPSFTRILRSPASFSRILRSNFMSPYERNMRAQHFSRILKRSGLSDEDSDSDFGRYLRSTSFSRIL